MIAGCAKQASGGVKVGIRGKVYTFELARTDEERSRGLMFRKELSYNSGMLFMFDKKDFLRFYMKNTFIPLDIAFMDRDFTILDIQKMESLDETIIISKYKSQYALEVNRGFFDRAGLKEGDKIKILTPLFSQ